MPGLQRLWTDFRNLSAILQSAPTPTGWPTARARHIAASALCSSMSASAPCSGQATTPAETAIRRPPARSSSSSLPSSRSAICTPSTVRRLGASTQIASSSSRKASSTRRMLSRRAAPTIASTVSRPPPASPLRVPGPEASKTARREGVAVAVVGLDQLVEPPPHLAGPEEAGELAPVLCRRRGSAPPLAEPRRPRSPSTEPNSSASRSAASAKAPPSRAELLAQFRQQRGLQR